ncbi:MAG: UDP-N-acetylmuramoyl-L-alanyl-D-glutamate--2,6-diaminopimelate ligase [Planctomycetes bacterium]|nr:UDP-N-acetylmuramoyl-L-alanyl-D-glutamate--2,6-diaminopimelate ligase [Planctomycetota bacterium]
MKLSHLIAKVDGVTVLGECDPEIGCVTDDSRKVTRGSLFVARSGTRGDGRVFIADAVARGASAVLCDGGVPCDEMRSAGVAMLQCADPAISGVDLAHAFAGFPASAMRMIGITGTNGKTTVAFLVQHLLMHASIKCGLIGTVVIDDGATRTPAELTTPGGMELARMLGTMARHGCDAVAMEVSSHALHQGRVRGIDFAVGVFTNLTGDHLDYHGTMDAYADAKAQLFDGLRPGACAVVNGDDPAHERMVRSCAARVVRCSTHDTRAECTVEVIRVALGGMRLRLHGAWGSFDADFPCVGRHNAMNALQAVAAAWALGVPAEHLSSGLSTASAPPGRLQPVTALHDPFAVLVDYAHTDDALSNVLAALRPVVGTGRIVLVFGCGGNRDRTKRPRMAATAVRGADVIYVTSDNPRQEDPNAIIAEILEGIPSDQRGRVHVQPDRAIAIQEAIAAARTGDIVLIAGKGHEDYQIIGTEKRHFDDCEQARAALQSRRSTQAQEAAQPKSVGRQHQPQGVHA